ncbi:hypothetical protein WJ32_25165 [Burkholderia ubonensis]|uniref:RNA 2'-phosphotransferase n=1 Tax=Burkholderia ubonensis TaxID=101571 RepID=A0A103RIY9_9BURK|nr:RNA 2'-phosphotransferase [Burkholderia ubonensis]AOJ67158.1 hypothetical protein WJ32_25165 [Burkholderia ubonensis]KVG68681.1 hypothetical protein WJ33_00620 [Burkholderia ubonensis]
MNTDTKKTLDETSKYLSYVLHRATIQVVVATYHGTATRFLDAIREQGLKASARHHVHLSRDVTTAISVGTRYGKPVVLAIDAQRMHARGFWFFVAENDVWLTDAVPAEFLSPLDTPAA